MVKCMRLISDKIKKHLMASWDVETIQKIVELLLFNNMTQFSVEYIDFLDGLIPDEDFSSLNQLKLLFAISYILSKSFYEFEIEERISSKYGENIAKFKVKYENFNEFNFRRTGRNNSTLEVALICLSKFQFKSFRGQLGDFVKDNALSYLDDPVSVVRKAASKAVSLISWITKKDNQMLETINRLLTIAITDSDMEVSRENFSHPKGPWNHVQIPELDL